MDSPPPPPFTELEQDEDTRDKIYGDEKKKASPELPNRSFQSFEGASSSHLDIEERERQQALEQEYEAEEERYSPPRSNPPTPPRKPFSSSSFPPPPPRRVVKPPSHASTSSYPTPITSHAPPPRRTVVPPPKAYVPLIPEKETWKQWSKRKGAAWGQVAMVRGVQLSDSLGGRFNGWAEVMGSERFWPTTGDFPLEMEKCARILRAFTVDGVEHTIEEKSVTGIKKQRRVAKKIPSRVIREAKGLAIFTSMRTGIAPFGGAGGAGVVVAKLEDGTWSAPSAMSPNNLSAGLMFGMDVYDAVLIIRTQAALDSFATHKATLGTELGVAAGPYGSGAALELGIEKSPVLSYIRSRGLYAGLEVVGQVFVERAEENELMYYWPGVRAGDILAGKVKVPECAASLQKALLDAETGKAQRMKGLELEFEEPLTELIEHIELEDGEILRLPPTPNQTIAEEAEEERRLREEGKFEDIKV